jgi:hypothetical protein
MTWSNQKYLQEIEMVDTASSAPSNELSLDSDESCDKYGGVVAPTGSLGEGDTASIQTFEWQGDMYDRQLKGD